MFSERLKMLRKRHGLTQKQLAERLNVDTSTIGKYEGKSNIIPSDDIKSKMADLFGVSVDYLMERTDNPVSISDNITEDELRMIELFRKLTDEGQSLVFDYANMLLLRDSFRKEQQIQSAI